MLKVFVLIVESELMLLRSMMILRAVRATSEKN